MNYESLEKGFVICVGLSVIERGERRGGKEQ